MNDDPGKVQQHLLNVARHHQQAPAQPSGKVTLTRTGTFHGAFPNTFWLSQAWSPDGSLLACGARSVSGRSGALHVWNGNTGQHEAHSMRHLTHGVTGQVVSIAWAPDSSRLATVEVNHDSGERVLCVRGQAGSRALAVPPDLKVSQVAWSPDGTTLALSGPDCARTVLLDPDSGAVRRELGNLSGPVAAGRTARSPRSTGSTAATYTNSVCGAARCATTRTRSAPPSPSGRPTRSGGRS